MEETTNIEETKVDDTLPEDKEIVEQAPLETQATSEKESHCLIKSCCQPTAVFLDNFITVIASLPVNQLHQYPTLVN